MPNHRLNYESCTICNLAPFCMGDEIISECSTNGHSLFKSKTLKRREALYLLKNKFQSLYAIQKGALKTYQAESAGKELIRGFYFTGEIVGYEAIHPGEHVFSAVAIDDCVVCEIPYDEFLEMLRERPELQKHLITLMSQQLNVGSYLKFTTAEQRVAAFLLDLLNRLNPADDALEFILPMSRQDIGNYLGLTAETTSRVLSRLHKNQIIKLNRKKVTILQMDSLKHLADG